MEPRPRRGFWAYCPSNPDVYPLVFDLFTEVIEVFKPKRYFHIGHDEFTFVAFGQCERCKGTPTEKLFAAEVKKLHDWLGGSGPRVEFYGLDISEGLLDLAKRRLPQWRDRFFLGNAIYWTPERKFDFVLTAELSHVPRGRERDLMEHLHADYVADGGRLILGPYTEERDSREWEEELRAWGYVPSGYCERSHAGGPDLCRRLLWFDKV